LRERKAELKIVVAGGSCGDPHWVRAAAQYPNLLLTGYLGVDQLPALMQHAVCLLNLSRHESFGTPVIEAMAAGTPVIAARLAALPEVVGPAGLLVDPGRPEEVADCIRNLYHDAALRRKLVELGRARARAFTWSACAGRLVQALAAKD
jgi:glycosyltransferase involved in cell wall biosynthesis